MTRYAAFLGGINVGGHRVTMDALKAAFVELGFTDVSTYIASGNVHFATADRRAGLEVAIETHLHERLGYAVPTFVRTDSELVALADSAPFEADGGTVHVGFLKSAPSAPVRKAVAALATDVDTLAVVGAELWWHLTGGLMSSMLAPKALSQAGLGPMTTRNVNTVRKLAARLEREQPAQPGP